MLSQSINGVIVIIIIISIIIIIIIRLKVSYIAKYCPCPLLYSSIPVDKFQTILLNSAAALATDFDFDYSCSRCRS